MNIFESAPVTATVKVSRSKAEKRDVVPVDGLSELAAINSLIASLEGLKPQYEGQVKGLGQDHYVAEALRTGKKPETFNLCDDLATGQYQMRKRSTASPLSPEELALADALGIPTVKNVRVEKRYVFNPEVLADQTRMEKISKALTRIPELAGMQIIQLQEAQETTVIADGAIEASCALKDKSKMVAALGIAGVQAIKTAFDSDEAQVALEVLSKAGIKLIPEPEPQPKAKSKKAKATV